MIGEEIIEVLVMVPATFIVKKIIRHKWALKDHVKSENKRVLIAPILSGTIKRGLFDESVLAHLLTSKFVDHLPLYRQKQILERIEMKIPPSTLTDNTNAACKALDRFNTERNIVPVGMQIFCEILLADNEAIIDNSFVSKVRKYLGAHVNMQEAKKQLIMNWKAEIPSQNVLLMDATYYEEYLRFPTNVQLLWECCQWIQGKQIPLLGKERLLCQIHSKYSIKNVRYSFTIN